MTQTKKVTTPTGVAIETTRGKLVLDKIEANEYQKAGTLTAQIRQEVTIKSSYPSTKVSTNLQANIFSVDDFEFESKDYTTTETRMAWLTVPANIQESQVTAKLDIAMENGGCIYKVLSNQPILDDNQKYAIESGSRTKDFFANKQVVRYPQGHEKEGQIILDNQGRVQYRRTFFWNTPMEDQDIRTSASVDYKTPEIIAELEGAAMLAGQTI